MYQVLAAAELAGGNGLQSWIIIGITVISAILIPLVIFLIRGAMRWTHVTDKLDELVEDVKKLVVDKDRAHAEIAASMNKVHAEILEQMRVDRQATDRRLRFLEERQMTS